LSGALLNPIAEVHAQGGFDYTLSNTGGVALTPGNSGFTTIIATLTSGSATATNVTLSCDLTNLPAGTTCAFLPSSVIPTPSGNATKLTLTVPPTAPYSAFNVTVTGKNPAPIIPTIFVLTVAAKIAVNPTATANLSDTSGTITVDLNVTYSPPFSGFIIGVFYNTSILRFQGIDYSGGVLGNDAQVSAECVDGLTSSQCAFPDPRFDAVGVVSLFLYTNSGENTTTPTGKLFSVTFTVVGVGFSAIHLVHQELQPACPRNSCNTFNVVQSVGYDGYFTNKDCGGGNLCKPPVVSFVPPPRPTANRKVSFNATAASQNLNGVITEYNWTWRSGVDVHGYNSPSAVGLKPSTNATFTFLNIGETPVTISVQDNYDARAYYTLTIEVIRVWVDLGFASLSIDHTVGVIPGTIIHIVANAINNGVNPENSSLRLSINNQNVATEPVVNLGASLESSLSYEWNTAGLNPRVYRLDVGLDEVRNATTNQILENDTAIIQGRLVDPNNARVAFVQLIEPRSAGFGLFLGLNLPETLGLGIVLIAVVVFVVGLVKKSRTPPPEPL